MYRIPAYSMVVSAYDLRIRSTSEELLLLILSD